MLKIALIAVGGGIGAVLRYVVSAWGQRLMGGSFPFGTFLVNVTGSLVIGFVGARMAAPHLVREEVRVFLLVGLLGGYTTFSTFGWETFMELNDGETSRALANLLITNAVGVTAVWLGYRFGERLFGV